jgi:leucyl-tRNA synthetase
MGRPAVDEEEPGRHLVEKREITPLERGPGGIVGMHDIAGLQREGGGAEHAVLHLLYARFYTMFLHDIGVVDFDEPFKKLFNQGMITGKNGIKMSKSKGNVVSPDDLIRDYGCDSLRLYELFVGPPELDAEWDDRGIDGVYRFLSKLYRLVKEEKDKDVKETQELVRLRHQLSYTITSRMKNFSLNTVVSAFMEFNNKFQELSKTTGVDKETLCTYARLLAPFAPHIAEELWEALGNKTSVFEAGWPEYDEKLMEEDTIEIPVQVNGKTKVVVTLPKNVSKDEAIKAGHDAVDSKLSGNVVKEIFVPGRIINFVIK